MAADLKAQVASFASGLGIGKGGGRAGDGGRVTSGRAARKVRTDWLVLHAGGLPDDRRSRSGLDTRDPQSISKSQMPPLSVNFMNLISRWVTFLPHALA